MGLAGRKQLARDRAHPRRWLRHGPRHSRLRVHVAILLAHRTGPPREGPLQTASEEFAYLSPRQSSPRCGSSQGCDENGRLTFRDVEGRSRTTGPTRPGGRRIPSVMLLPATSLYKRRRTCSFDAEARLHEQHLLPGDARLREPGADLGAGEQPRRACRGGGHRSPASCGGSTATSRARRHPWGLKVTTCGLCSSVSRSTAVQARLEGRSAGSSGRTKRRGVGMASLIHVGGSGRIYRSDASGIILRLDDFGKRLRATAAGVEMGQGLHSALSLMRRRRSSACGRRTSFINQTDTATCPWDVGTHASRGAFTALQRGGSWRPRRSGSALFTARRGALRRRRSHAEPREKHRAKAHPGYEPRAGLRLRRRPPRRDRLRPAQDGLALPARMRPDRAVGARIELGRFLRAMHFRDGRSAC